eukprot:gene30018-18095_t
MQGHATFGTPYGNAQQTTQYLRAHEKEPVLPERKVPQEDFLWTAKPCYGKNPMYLRRNKDTVKREKEAFEEMTTSTSPALDASERAQLLRHLKTKWGSINTAYQKQPFVTDSDMKKSRKEELERSLAEIERDIKSLERGETVLIVDG